MADLTGKVIKTNYQKLLNTDSTSITDGTGSNPVGNLTLSGSISASGTLHLGTGSYFRLDGGDNAIPSIGITGSEANGIPMIKLYPQWNGEFIYGVTSDGNSFRLRQGTGGAGTLELYSSGSSGTGESGDEFVAHSFQDPFQDGTISYVNYTPSSSNDPKFGIGTKDPKTTLHVAGTISASGWAATAVLGLFGLFNHLTI